MRYAQLATCCDIMVSETLAGRCQGTSENWRSTCVDAMRRACEIDPDNEEWKVRLLHFEACERDEMGLEAEARELEQQRQRQRGGEHGQEGPEQQSEARRLLQDSQTAKESLSTSSHFSCDDEETEGQSMRDGDASEETSLRSANQLLAGAQAPPLQQKERMQEVVDYEHGPSAARIYTQQDQDQEQEQEQEPELSSPESEEMTPRLLASPSNNVASQLAAPWQSPASIPLPISPAHEEEYQLTRAPSSRQPDELDLVHAQLAKQRRVNEELLERLARIEEKVDVMREQQEINTGIGAMERELKRLRDRQEALDRRIHWTRDREGLPIALM